MECKRHPLLTKTTRYSWLINWKSGNWLNVKLQVRPTPGYWSITFFTRLNYSTVNSTHTVIWQNARFSSTWHIHRSFWKWSFKHFSPSAQTGQQSFILVTWRYVGHSGMSQTWILQSYVPFWHSHVVHTSGLNDSPWATTLSSEITQSEMEMEFLVHSQL